MSNALILWITIIKLLNWKWVQYEQACPSSTLPVSNTQVCRFHSLVCTNKRLVAFNIVWSFKVYSPHATGVNSTVKFFVAKEGVSRTSICHSTSKEIQTLNHGTYLLGKNWLNQLFSRHFNPQKNLCDVVKSTRKTHCICKKSST